MTSDDWFPLFASLLISLEVIVILYIFYGDPKSQFHQGLCEGLTFRPLINLIKSWLNRHKGL